MHVLFVFHVGNFTYFLLYIAMVLWFNSIIVKDKRKVIQWWPEPIRECVLFTNFLGG